MIDFMVQNTNYQYDRWSLMLSYDPTTSVTTGLLSADETKVDIDYILRMFKSSNAGIIHPFLLPSIIYRKVMESSITHFDQLHEEISAIEAKTEITKTRKPREGLVEDQHVRDEEDDTSDLSKRLNTVKKDQASRDGRHQFWKQCQQNMSEAMDNVLTTTSDPGRQAIIKTADEDFRIWISMHTRIFEFLETRDINHGARIKAQLDYVCLPSIRSEVRSLI